MTLLEWPVLGVILMMVAAALAIVGLAIARLFVLPHINYHEGVNDAISGTLGVIGVFYGITIGLIVIEVWQRHSSAESIVEREAAAITMLYVLAKDGHLADPGAKPTNKSNVPDTAEPTPAAKKVSAYLDKVLCNSLEKHRKGTTPDDWKALRDIRTELVSIEPKTEGAKVRYAVVLQSFVHLVELNRMRVEVARDSLSWQMWMIIICGAAMSIFAMYLCQFKGCETALCRGLYFVGHARTCHTNNLSKRQAISWRDGHQAGPVHPS